MKFALIGRTQMLLNTAKLFVKNGHSLVLVATAKPAPEYTAKAEDFARLAKENDAIFLQGVNLAQNMPLLQSANAQLAISMNWPAILNSDVISVFPYGVLNAHPGDLPRYRGNACPNWAMLLGEKKVVLTIHKMAAEELDSGDILAKEQIALGPKTTIGQVYEQLEQIMPTLYLKAAEGLLDGSIIPMPQSTNPKDILRVHPRLGADSFIDWAKPAQEIELLVRASGPPFGGAYSYYKGVRLGILDAAAGNFAMPSIATPGQVLGINRQNGQVQVATGQGFLNLLHITYKGQHFKNPAQLISSARDRLGMQVADEIAALKLELEELRAQFLAFAKEKT